MDDNRQLQQVTLDEVREVRTILIDVVQRLSSLEAQNKSILGNGQPGILTIHGQDIEELKYWRWRMAGIITCASAVVSFAIAWVFKIHG